MDHDELELAKLEGVDWKLLTLSRASYRVMQEVMRAILITGSSIQPAQVMDYRSMLIKPDWTSVFILVKIPHRMKVQSNCHASNLEFFTKIRGVTVSDPPAQPVPQ